jgi:SpoVK/Ycf46/Vps4 family AAA+-type ATPase
MTFDEFTRAMATSLIDTQTIDVKAILEHKKQAIKKSEILEVINLDTSMNDVGGLDELKTYFERYSSSFSDEAKAFGVEALKGVIMTGIAGTGKSLAAKAVATHWKIPLLRMDVGKIMGSLVGQSEQRMRDALKHAAACAPCVLWIDEMEKGLSGTQSSGSTDGGTTARVFGTLLTWMQECDKDVVVVATANDVSQLPPELIRRFNETFFVDLPLEDEREEILRIHLNKRKRDPETFDIEAIVKATVDYTGAEIEKIVKESIAAAYTQGDSVVATEHILKAASELKPISKQMADRISELRTWADGKARFASSGALKARAGKKKKFSKDLDAELGKSSKLTKVATKKSK